MGGVRMANKRLTDASFVNDFTTIETFFVKENGSVKQVEKDKIVFGINNGGTGATTVEEALKNLNAAHIDHAHTFEDVGAAAKDHTHTLESIGAPDKSVAFSLDIPVSAWGKTGMTARVSFSSHDISDKNIVVSPYVNMDDGEDYYELWCEFGIHAIKQLSNEIIFACTERPEEDIKASVLILG